MKIIKLVLIQSPSTTRLGSASYEKSLNENNELVNIRQVPYATTNLTTKLLNETYIVGFMNES